MVMLSTRRHGTSFERVRLDPARAVLVGVDDDGHARDAGRLGMADLSADSMLNARRRNSDATAVQDTGLVVHVNGECMKHRSLPTANTKITKTLKLRNTRKGLGLGFVSFVSFARPFSCLS